MHDTATAPSPYLRSLAGRLLLATTALFLFGMGLACMLPAPLAMSLGIFTPLLVVLGGLWSVGLGFESHPIATVLVAVIGPILLWVGYMGATLLRDIAPMAGAFLIASALVVLGFAVVAALGVAPRHGARLGTTATAR